MDIYNKICNESYIPTELECICAIEKDLNSYYIIASRRDIPITTIIKYVTYEKFKKEKKKPFSGLAESSDKWFIDTQLDGFGYIPPLYKRAFNV